MIDNSNSKNNHSFVKFFMVCKTSRKNVRFYYAALVPGTQAQSATIV